MKMKSYASNEDYELSYHGDPCKGHMFRILEKDEAFPAWHPERYDANGKLLENFEFIY